MYFCIRDDDTSFFTAPEELESAYGDITRWGPVSLAVVPFHRAGTSKGVPEKFRGRWSVHPLHENKELVAYLRLCVQKGTFEIMLHGYHHDEPNGRAEFSNGSNLDQKIIEGRRYLEDLLDTTVRVFVPPHNIISAQALRAIADAGLHLGGVGGMRSGWPLLSCRSWLQWIRLRLRDARGESSIPWVLDLGDHREIPGQPVTPAASFAMHKTNFDAALKLGGVFCVATHYWELAEPSTITDDPTVGEQLSLLINRALSDGRVIWRSVGDVLRVEPS